MKIFKTSGTCADEIRFEIKDGVIEKVDFVGGCNGSLTGIATLVEGQPIEEVVEKLKGIACRNGTSCPDQLSKALQDLVEEENKTV
ncbi:TIGR03905 family TSCPD domain-containing protein [Natroniella sulfidigena]|uniref:TIGR03905 family TSCPD domain-containing protein n=1 Tax=Natroniella sulfidigena TaxID=723921 RepID=UPI00200A847F|nr:TIGR03905 family TSCPD domain-containing protein [Natroniella sulfidigena]MCK8816081.1 TIGR03905 family TSCPD domain-containing protein [Natroniella sulfidigena]